MPLDSIRTLIEPDFEAMNAFISSELTSEVPFINQLVEYILGAGGKRVRPLLVLLTTRALNYQDKRSIHLAASVELIHTATLLHDDVIDNSSLRRGRETTNKIWGNQASVLVGDFLYSRAFQFIVQLKNQDIFHIFSQAMNLIAEGEIMQLLNCHNPETKEESYFEVIQRKTAKLFEVATHAAVTLTQNTSQYHSAMQQYGLHLGMAYQLIDDALDFNSSADITGKNIGNDLAEGKPTLPLIYAISRGTPAEAKLIRDAIKTGSTENLESIISIIESTGAIEYTALLAKQHAHHSKTSLAMIPESPYRQALHDLTEFAVERRH